MKYFEVYKDEIVGRHRETLICSDGTEEDGTAIKGDRETTYLVAYIVYEYEENGVEIDRKVYYIDRGSKGNDPDSVLDRIKEDHQPDMWQCNNW